MMHARYKNNVHYVQAKNLNRGSNSGTILLCTNCCDILIMIVIVQYLVYRVIYYYYSYLEGGEIIFIQNSSKSVTADC